MAEPDRLLQAEATWQTVRELVDASARQRVKRLVDQDADALSALFYREMLNEPAMARLLDHDGVSVRLHASMARWLRVLFDETTPLADLLAMQRRTGEVHARIGVRPASVAHGARVLKRAIARHLVDAAPRGAAVAVQYVYELLDMAMDAMGDSAEVNAARMARSDESYRLHFLTQNLRAERERQRSHLLEWSHQLLMRHYWDRADEGTPEDDARPRLSPFQLWVEHKATMLFEHAPELQPLRDGVAAIERELLLRLRAAGHDAAAARPVVAELHRRIEHLKSLLTAMFDRAAELEDGRDGVTRLLSRRYVAPIVKREIELARAGGPSFALLLADLDRHDDIAHALGAEVADQVLAGVADTLSEHVRAGDFVFRVGDARFLVLLVEVDEAGARDVADGLRRQVGSTVPRVPGGLVPRLSITVGIAPFDGHPDYQVQVERAEAALRRAQATGGDPLSVAPPGR